MHTSIGDLIRSKLGFLDVMGSSQHQDTLKRHSTQAHEAITKE